MNSKSQKGRIVFLEDSRLWGGVEKWILTTAKEFKHHGLQVTIAAPESSELVIRGKRLGLDTFPLDVYLPGKILHPVNLLRFIIYLKTYNVKALFLNGSNEFKFGGLAAYLAGIEKVIYRRGAALPVNNKFYNRFLFSRVITKLIVNSKNSRQCILKELPGTFALEKIEVIYNGVDLEKFSPKGHIASVRKEFNIPQNHILACCIGRLAKQKGYEYIFEILKKAHKKFKEFSVLIVGEGELEQKLKSSVKEKGVEKRVFFLGFRKDIPDILRASDFLLHTPLWEGAPNVIQEAMACGKPVISWNVSGIPELVENGKTGYLCQSGNISEVANIIEKMIKDIRTSKAQDMGLNARKRAEKIFSIDKMVNEYLKMIG